MGSPNGTAPPIPTEPVAPPMPDPAGEKPEAISALEFEPDIEASDETDGDVVSDPDADLAMEFFAEQKTPAVVDPAVVPPVPVGSDPALQQPPVPTAPQMTPAPPVATVAPVPDPAAVQPTAAPTPSVQTDPQPTAPPAPSPNAPEEAFRVLSDAITRERPAIIDAVAAGQYQLTNEELTLVATEPEKVLPTLMARVHVNAVQGVLTHVAQQLPAVVGGMIKAQQMQADLENKFYSAWPQLDRTKHDNVVRHLAATYRQMNPSASFEDITRIVGAQALFAAGIAPQAAVTPAAPAAPVTRQVPFQPAAAARTAAAPGRSEPGTWEKMAAIMAADDAGLINSE